LVWAGREFATPMDRGGAVRLCLGRQRGPDSLRAVAGVERRLCSVGVECTGEGGAAEAENLKARRSRGRAELRKRTITAD
jgi:hypothetical protein